jgi:hypothetical protein
MASEFLSYGISYACLFLEAAWLVVFVGGTRRRKLWAPAAFVAAILADSVVGQVVLHRYGLTSHAYAYFYWLSDVVLALGAFLLVCAFFRRACSGQTPLWRHMRLLLALVFVLVVGVSLISLSRNYTSLFTIFIIEFEQNLYFTCLVLISLLYILMQYFQPADDELGLLVCGLGIQFAGPAANFALVHLTSGEFYSASLLRFIPPLCTLAMLSIWTYAVAGMRKAARPSEAPIREEARLRESEA